MFNSKLLSKFIHSVSIDPKFACPSASTSTEILYKDLSLLG